MHYEISPESADALAPLVPGNVPVGTIIAYVAAPTSLPPEWEVCDGHPIRNRTSPWFGQPTPQLSSDVFLRGVSAAADVRNLKGQNEMDEALSTPITVNVSPAWGIPSGAGGNHPNRPSNWSPSEWGHRFVRDVSNEPAALRVEIKNGEKHDHAVDKLDLAHTHGSNMPVSFGVLWIPRVA